MPHQDRARCLRWDRQPGTHQVGWFDRNKPSLGKAAAPRTPPEFARELVALAAWSCIRSCSPLQKEPVMC